jgi:peroxiredoxin
MNDTPEMAKAFGEKHGINYPIVFDQTGTVIRELGVVTAPSTLFVDSSGNIVDQVAGEISSDKLESLIAQWFAS